MQVLQSTLLDEWWFCRYGDSWWCFAVWNGIWIIGIEWNRGRTKTERTLNSETPKLQTQKSKQFSLGGTKENIEILIWFWFCSTKRTHQISRNGPRSKSPDPRSSVCEGRRREHSSQWIHFKIDSGVNSPPHHHQQSMNLVHDLRPPHLRADSLRKMRRTLMVCKFVNEFLMIFVH